MEGSFRAFWKFYCVYYAMYRPIRKRNKMMHFTGKSSAPIVFAFLALAWLLCFLNFWMLSEFQSSRPHQVRTLFRKSEHASVCGLVAMPSRSTERELRDFQRGVFQEYLNRENQLQVTRSGVNIVLRFVIGQNNDVAIMDKVVEEQAIFGDLEILDIQEAYENLTAITYALFERAVPFLQGCATGFLVKVDSDFLLGYKSLASVLLELPTTSTYFGTFFPNLPIHTSGRLSSDHAHSFFPLFANGGLYGMSTDVVELMTSTAVQRTVLKQDKNYSFREEDASIGIALFRSGSTVENLVFTRSAFHLCATETYNCEDYGHAIGFSVGIGLSGSGAEKLKEKRAQLDWLRQQHTQCQEHRQDFKAIRHLSMVDAPFNASRALDYLFYGCNSLNDEGRLWVESFSRMEAQAAREMSPVDPLYDACAEKLYRRYNPLVDDLIRTGVYPSGKQHYLEQGWKNPSMHYFCPETCYHDTDNCKACDKEQVYLDSYPDVKENVLTGGLSSGLFHFEQYGQADARSYSCYERYQEAGHGDGKGCLALYHRFIEVTQETVSTWPIYGQEAQLNSGTCKTVVIVEGRDHPWMDYILRVHRRYTGHDWLFVLVGPPKTTNIWRERYNGPMVTIVDLPVWFGDLSDYPKQYNEVLKSTFLWKDVIKCENVLISQTDALLLRHGIEDFMQYSYVGSPVYLDSFPSADWRYLCAQDCNFCGGNGGFSLRRRSSMLRAIRDCQSKLSDMEDVWYSACMIELQESLPHTTIANRFSTGSKCNIDVPLGFHKIWQNCKTSSCAHALLMSRLYKDVFGNQPASGQCQEGEKAYLAMYPDVRAAVEQGAFSSGWHHFDQAGRKEQRVYRCLPENIALDQVRSL